MKYLHTMVRVADLDQALDFYCNKFGLEEVRRKDSEQGRFTLVFLAAPDDGQRSKEERAPEVELTYNWDPETYDGGRNFGHLAYEVDNIYATCDKLMKAGVTINRPAARRQYGVRPLTRQHLHRDPAEGSGQGAG